MIGGKHRSFDTHIYIDFAGEVECRHTHTFTYEAEDCVDTEEAQSAHGERIEKAMQIISTEVSQLMSKADLSLLKKTDLTLKKFYEDNYATKTEEGEEAKEEDEHLVGQIVVKVCSEALVHGIAKCYDSHEAFRSYANLFTGSEPHSME